MWAVWPLLALPVALYNVAVLLSVQGGLRGDATEALTHPLFSVAMSSRGVWVVNLGDLMLFGSLAILFVELLKSTARCDIAIINHSLSMILFIICLVEFLLLRAFATSTFFLIAIMVLLDVLAGFIVTIAATRREIDLR